MTAKDPVCGMTVQTAASSLQSKYEGKEFCFCSEACRRKFEATPAQFAGGAGKTSKAGQR